MTPQAGLFPEFDNEQGIAPRAKRTTHERDARGRFVSAVAPLSVENPRELIEHPCAAVSTQRRRDAEQNRPGAAAIAAMERALVLQLGIRESLKHYCAAHKVNCDELIQRWSGMHPGGSVRLEVNRRALQSVQQRLDRRGLYRQWLAANPAFGGTSPAAQHGDKKHRGGRSNAS